MATTARTSCIAWPVIAFLVTALMACGGGGDGIVAPPPPPAPAVATSITATSSASVTGVAGAAVAELPSVIARDQRGTAMPAVAVTFAVASGGGTVTGATQTTNDSGVATVGGWTLGTTAGANTLTATAGSLAPVTFSATGTAGGAASVTKAAGDTQTATVGTAVGTAPAVMVEDSNGNAVSGVAVTFAVASGGGTVTGATQTTNSSGVATVGGWTLGTTAGANALTATAGSLASVTFTASGLAGPATSVTKVSGDNQTTVAGAPVSVPPQVLVKDSYGNVVSGASVTFAVTSGAGSVTGAVVATDVAGQAAVGSWNLGSAIGANSLSAATPGAAAVTFAATGTDPCAVAAHSLGTTTSGSLESWDCKLSDGSSADFFSTSISATNAFLFTHTATALDTYLFLLAADQTPVAWNDNASSTSTSSSIKALLLPGNYILVAGSAQAGATGSYALSSATTSAEVANCQSVFVVSGITTSQNITTSDCFSTTIRVYEDWYLVFLEAGQSLTVSMSAPTDDPDPLDSFLEVYDTAGSRVASNDDKDETTLDAEIAYTAPVTGYYRIVASTVYEQETGAYSITIQ